MRVIAIHGFLGLPSDWDLVFTGVSGLEIEHVNLWNDLKTLGSSASFRTWAELFIERTGKNPERPMLVGYSLGGRLAMQAITMAPHAFSSAVIVSANPGLKNVDEKRDRLAADFKWAERFSKEPWSELMTAWNSQNVFAAPATSAKDRILLERSEADFDRGFLAQSLDVWSLARQADLSIPLRSFAKPLKMVTGREDLKFTAIAEELLKSAPANFSSAIIENAAHRVPWDNPAEFSRHLRP